MIKVRVIDLKQIDFKCLRCGNCCYNMLRKIEGEDFFFDHKGVLTENPTISVAVDYKQKQVIERALDLKSSDVQWFYPLEVLFTKEHRVGFIYEYQIKVKKKQVLRFLRRKK